MDDEDSPQHFRPTPKFSRSLNDPTTNKPQQTNNNINNNKKIQQRRARSISPPQKKKSTTMIPNKQNSSVRRNLGGSSSFTNLANVKSASQSVASAASSYEQTSKIEQFNDKRDSLENAGLARVKTLNNHIKDQKVVGAASYEQAKKSMDTDDWETEIKGIEMIVSILRGRPDILRNDIKTVIRYMMEELKNLRSQVCRVAGQAFAELYLTLGKAMEVDLEKATLLLLQKAADTNKFIRESCNEALDVMVENVTLLHAVQSVTESGVHHKSPVVRATVARLLGKVVTQLGSERFMGSSRELQELVMKSGSKLLVDSNQDVRKNSRTMFAVLVRHRKFDALQQQTLREEERRDIKKTLEGL